MDALGTEAGPMPIYLYRQGGEPVAIMQPGIGAPLAAGCVDELWARGCDRFVACGGCGVLDRSVAVGHLLVPTHALRDEGTSYHYAPASRWIEPTPVALQAIRDELTVRELPYLDCKTWTNDAFYRETPGKVALRREEAAALSPGGDPYEALMDRYEPGSRVEELVPLFEALKRSLSTLVRAVGESGVVVDDTPVRGTFPPEQQLAFARDIVARMGFDGDAGRIDRSAHPFCTSMGHRDVRITWRHADDDLRPALMGLMHEAGHALYEQGLPEDWQRTPLGNATSLGIHESQSRLWENLLGRSRPFWRFFLPRLKEAIPGPLDEVDLVAFHEAINEVRPLSLIHI